MAQNSHITYAKEHGLNDANKAEELFQKAEDSVKKERNKSIKDFTENDWTYVMGIFKKMVGNATGQKQESLVQRKSRKKIKESFSAKMVPDAVQKIVSVLERDLKVDIGLFPFPYEGKGGLTVYKAMLGNENYPITFNFKDGTLVSIGKLVHFNDDDIVQEIEFKNQFILGILTEIEAILERYLSDGYFSYPPEYVENELLEGKYEKIKNRIEEQGRKPNDAFDTWIKDIPNALDMLVNERITRVYTDEFLPWAEENKVMLSTASFYNKVKAYLKQNKSENIYTRKTNIIDGGGKVVLVDEAPQEEKLWNEMMNETAEGAFVDIEKAILAMVEGIFNSIYIFGTAGVGKTTAVKKFLAKEKAETYFVTGGIKDTKSLVKVLYEHRKDEIIVFDDTNLIKNKAFREILLAALDDTPVRTISWFDAKEMNKTRNKSTPEQFEFTSGVVFISNETKVDPAIKSRTILIPIFLTKEQILDMISKRLKDFLPKTPMDIKEEVFEWFLDNNKEFEHIDFRQFKFAVGMAIVYKGDSAWKTNVLKRIAFL